MLVNNEKRSAAVKEKIIATNRAFYANKKLLKTKYSPKELKRIYIYKTIITLTLLYAAKSMVLSQRETE